MDDRQPVSLSRRLLSYLICSLVAFQPLLPAFSAAITPVTPGTGLDAAGNGVPVLNVATPNQAGLSHNQYQDYNVGKEGLILNNATDKLTQSQLGGLIQNNPNLKAGQEAKAIINEVVGANRSQLQGYTEVAGKAANVMVANPYGITCNGCGFINTPNVTLTTGKPQLDAQGNLQSLDVTKGAITIEGQGLDGSQADAVAIIARATEINAGIYAKDLRLTAGANRVDANGAVTPIAGEGAAPSVAVDTGALGGMYANRIHLVSSEKGVGVNLGNLNARQGDIVLDANGRLTLNNSLTSGTLTAKGSSVALQGEHKTGSNITLVAEQDLTLTAVKLASNGATELSSRGNLTIKGSSLTAGQTMRLTGAAIALDNTSNADSADAMQLTSQTQLENAGQLTAGKKLSIHAGQVANSGNLSGQGLHIDAAAQENSGKLLSSSDAVITANNFQQRGMLSAQNTTEVTVAGQLSNSGELSGSSLKIHSGALDNSGKLISSGDATVITGQMQQSGMMSASGNAQLEVADRLSNSGELNSSSLNIHSGAFDNSGKLISSGDATVITGLMQQSGTLSAQGKASLNIADVLSNSGTLIGGSLQTQSATLDNSGVIVSNGEAVVIANTLQQNGTISAQGNAQLTAHDALNNRGAITSNSALAITSATLRNEGSLTAPTLTLNTPKISNGGLIQGSQLLDIRAALLDNLADGTLTSGNDFALNLPQLNNSGLISSDAALSLEGGQLTNAGEINGASLSATLDLLENQQGGRLLANGAIQLQGDRLLNDGEIAADTLNSDVSSVNNSGVMQGSDALALQGDSMINSGTLLSGGQLNVQHQSLDNSGLLQGKQLTLNADRWQNSGNALSEADADLRTSDLSNSGKILGQQAIRLQTSTADNTGWLVAQALTLHGNLINGGLIQGNRSVDLSGNALNNQAGGQILSGGTLNSNTVMLDNQGAIQADEIALTADALQNGGSIRATSVLTAQVSNTLANRGSLLSEQQMSLQTAELNNQGTLAGDRLSLSATQLTNGGLLQGNSTLLLQSVQLVNLANGNLISGGALDLNLNRLDNDGLLQVNDALVITGQTFNNHGQVTADSLSTQLSGILANGVGAQLLAQQQADIQAVKLDNAGNLASQRLNISGDEFTNRGLLQGDTALDIQAGQLHNLAGGQLLSGGELSLQGDHARNEGNWQGDKLGLTFNSLENHGVINGISALNGNVSETLENSGSLLTQGNASLSTASLNNSGKIMASGLTLQVEAFNNSGLVQGNNSLDVQADSLIQTATGKALSGGVLTLNAGQLNTAGTLQGERADIIATDWQHQGSLLGSNGLTASIGGQLTNTGELLSQGEMHIGAQALINSGSLLGQQAVMLTGSTLNNSGAVQGKTLTITPASVINQGSLIGLQALTLGALPQTAGRMMLRMLAVPTRELINNSGGSMLTQGTLSINGGNITNNGSWQAQQILLNAQQLTNNGAIQSADGMQLLLGDRLDSGAGSKISAGGTAVLQAMNLATQGQWMAKNLTLNGGTLNNNGEISGVDALAVNLSGAMTQQQDKTLLTAGKLTLHSASLNNAGRVQGGSLEITSGAIDNNGRLQGDNNLLVTAGGRLSNNGNGSLLTQNTLTLTTPELYNYGLIQGGGTSNVGATGVVNNAGRLLSGGELTLTTPQLANGGWLQATRLILNAASADNGGTLLANQQGTLTGNDFTNQGTAQGGNLAVNYQQLTNRGTLLGANQLTITAAQVNQQAPGRLFSGGNLLLHSNGFDQAGQVVALGDATLQLNNGFTGRDVLAAGNRLSISSNGAIDNQGTLQGQALTLSAGGDFTNNGQLTTGTGDSSLSGSRIAMNGNGTLQGGGNVNLISHSDIVIDGFTGARGSLLLSAPGSIVNNALLYAGNNLNLYAGSIKNQRADMLAGNSLWMQRDAAGNANSEVINTSGTIETQNGDITVNTGHLLNTRDGLQVMQNTTTSPTRAGVGDATMKITIWQLAVGDYGYYTQITKTPEHDVGGANGCGCTVGGQIVKKDYYAPTKDAATQKFALSTTSVDVISTGGAARLASGRDISINAGSLDNQASNLLANGNITLAGGQLNNQSWQAGTQSDYAIYEYKGPLATGTIGEERTRNATKGSEFTYTLTGHENTFTPGELYRSVIQAGGNVSASFNGDISNTNTTANAGWSGNTLAAPAIKGLNALSSASVLTQQQLSAAGNVTVNSPQWRDQLQDALRQVNAAAGLDSAPATGIHLADYTVGVKNSAGLGKVQNLADIGSGGAKPLASYQAGSVDTSAYPLPSGNNGYFVASGDSKSRYLITVNPKLNGLGQLDQSLFGDLNALLGKHPDTAPQETRTQYTDEKAFLGSSYLLGRLNLKPDYDYRFLGDAAFDTRYVSNVVLNQTGSRYLNGIGSDLDQMRYLMDNAAAAQQSLGLQFGVSLSADQLASLDKSIIWWEASTVNGETVMIPKLYLSPKDIDLHDGSVIAGNNVSLNAGSITNSGSTMTAQNALSLDSQNTLSNLNAGLIQAGGNLQLSALGDINNVGSTISGKTVALESLNGDINNLTTTQQWALNASNGHGASKSFTETLSGPVASIAALDSLSLKAGNDINVTGATLKAGGNLLMDAWKDIAVTSNQQTTGNAQSGFYNGWRKIDATSTSTTTSQGSQISAGGNLAMQAGRDLDVTASSISAGKNATLAAGNDLNLNSAATQQNSAQGKRESHSTGVDRTTLTSGGDLALLAGRDLNSDAAGIASDGDVALQAGRDVNLLAAETRSGNSYKAGKKVEINESVRQQGTEIASGGSTTINAGRDVTSEAAQVTVSKDIAVSAGRDINLTTTTDSDYAYKEETKTKKGFFSKKTTHTIQEDSATRENGTLLSGNNVALKAGNNLLVQGSQVVGDDNVTLKAGNNVDIVAATNTDSAWRFSETKKSGLMGTGGIGITIGSSKSMHDLRDRGTTQSQSASTVGSTGGNVSIVAGGQAHVSGSDLVAGKDLALSGDSVVIDPGRDKRTHDETFEQKKSGLTLALSGLVGEAINNAVAAAQTSKKESDGRLAALQATKAALSGVQAVLGAQLSETSADPNNGMGVSLSLTTQKSKSQQHQASDSVSGSTLNAGKNLSIISTGKGSGEHSGDILIAGSQLKAAGDSSLNAANDIVLSGAANTQESSGKNSSNGGGVGISFGAGQGSAGISIFASVNGAKGKESGNGTRWSETTLDSGGKVSLNSGRDTSLNGAQVSGNQVTADVGRDLNITSQQDSDRYDSKQTSYGAGGSFTFGSMTVSGYASVNQDKMHSNFDSVQEQSGIYAGKGGFDLTVGNHTQLNGAVIASQGDAADNRLDTGTLGFTDIGNAADYKVSHSGGSIAMSGGGGMGAQMLSNVASNAASTLLSGLNNNGHAEGTTQAAVANGTVIIRDRANQKQEVADLSRDTGHANGSISAIFDKEKEQKRLQTAQLAGEITGQMTNIVTTMGDIKGLEEAKKSAAPLKENATEAERADWLNGLRNSSAYQQEMKEWGVGSQSQKVAQTVGSILTGLVTGNAGQAVAGGLNPWAAQLIKQQTTDATGNVDVAANAMAHAVWGAVSAQMSGGNAAAGAAGAFSGELATRYIAAQYWGADTPEKIAALKEDDREQLSLLGTLAAGLAGGMAGNSSTAATAGAITGKNAVENNYLSDKDITTFTEKYAKAKTDAEKEQLRSDLKKLDAAQQAKALSTGISVNDQKSELAKLKQLAASSDCVGQCQELANYSISQLEPVANNTQLHKDNLTKAVLASTIFALTLDQPAKSGEKTPAAGANSVSKPASAIDDIVNGTGGAVGIGKTAAEATTAKAEAAAANAAKNGQLPMGTVFDSIKGTQPVHPGSVIPQSFEMSLPNGQKVWVHGNATEHMAEYAASKAVTHTPEAVRLASQEELRSFQSAVNTATKNNMPYGERITVDGWQLEIKPPRAVGELPTIIHARYVGAH